MLKNNQSYIFVNVEVKNRSHSMNIYDVVKYNSINRIKNL